MARLAQNKLITTQMRWHSNMTDKNHLGRALMTRPAKVESIFNKLFTATRYSGNPLTGFLSSTSRSRDLTDDQWEWTLRGATTRPVVSVERVEPATVTKVGVMNTNYKLKVDEPFFLPGDILHPGTSNKKWQSRIQTGPIRHGQGWIYEMALMTDNPAEFLPGKYLEPGQQWGKLYSKYEEAADQSGSTQYSTPLALRNRMSRYRKEYRVTGDAAQTVLAVKVPGKDGKYYDAWMKYAEMEYWEQWYRELERGNWYSRSTTRVPGANGRMVNSGPGIQEMLEDSHRHFYSHLTAKLIEEYLMDIFYGRVKPGKGRHIRGYTGEYGMLQFHRAIMDWASKSGFIQVVDSIMLRKTASDYHSNGLEAGFQYVKYQMANGSTLTLEHLPLYDDREINFEIDTLTGFPTESQRITFLDFAGEKTDSNIQLYNKKDSLKLAYIAGLQNPYGPANNELASHPGDYYEFHVQKQCGTHIEDVSRCGELILKRNS